MKATGPTSFSFSWDHQTADFFLLMVYADQVLYIRDPDIVDTRIIVTGLPTASVYLFSVAAVFNQRTGEFYNVSYDISGKFLLLHFNRLYTIFSIFTSK